MNILYCGDSHMQEGLFLSVLSLLKHTQEKLMIYVLTAEITTSEKVYQPIQDDDIALLNNYVQQSHPENRVIKFDITELVNKNILTANWESSFTPNCMLRLFADQVVALPDKILYLDTDIICYDDFSDFYQQNLENYDVCGVLDRYGKWFFHRQLKTFDYLNSGVLLINLKRVRETGLFERCRQLCERKWMFMPDQSAINRLSKAKKIAPTRYNEQHEPKDNTVFQHFTTRFKFFPWFKKINVKPWQMNRVHEELQLHDYDDLFLIYQELTEESLS